MIQDAFGKQTTAYVSQDALQKETANLSPDASRVWAQMHFPGRKECELWINFPEQGGAGTTSTSNLIFSPIYEYLSGFLLFWYQFYFILHSAFHFCIHQLDFLLFQQYSKMYDAHAHEDYRDCEAIDCWSWWEYFWWKYFWWQYFWLNISNENISADNIFYDNILIYIISNNNIS